MARPWTKKELDKNMEYQEKYIKQRTEESEAGARKAPGWSGAVGSNSWLNKELGKVAKSSAKTAAATPAEQKKKKFFSKALARIMDYKAGGHD